MMTTFKIRLEGSDGKVYVETYQSLKQRLGICKLQDLLSKKANWAQKERDVLFQQIDRLTNDIIDTELPRMKWKIMDLLKENPDIRTRQITEKTPWQNKILWRAFQRAFKELQDAGEIIGTSHGAGHNRTWRVA